MQEVSGQVIQRAGVKGFWILSAETLKLLMLNEM